MVEITFTITAPDWAPTGYDKAIVEHHASVDGAILASRRADINDWVADTHRLLSAKAWQDLSGQVTGVGLRQFEKEIAGQTELGAS